jgi:hypothetical protein
LDAAKGSIGIKKRIGPRPFLEYLYDETLMNSINERKKCHRKWISARGSFEEGVLLIKYLDARKSVVRETRMAKLRRYAKYSLKVDEMNSAEKLKHISRQKKFKSRSSDCPLPVDEEGMEKIQKHFQGMFGKKSFHDQSDAAFVPGDTDSDAFVFDISYIEKSISLLPSGKASGISMIKNELIKAGVELLSPFLLELFRCCWETRTIPSSWKKILITPVFKKGDKSCVTNYRPISLTETLRKLFEGLILHTIKPLLDPFLDVAQSGFRANHSTVNQVACLNETLIKRKEEWDNYMIAFLDIKAAYDSVERRLLWEILLKRVSGHLVSILQDLFDFNVSNVVVKGNMSKEVVHEVGLLQGSLLSPLLYAVYIDELPRLLKNVYINNSLSLPELSTFLYADDIALVAPNPSVMDQMLKVCDAFARKMNFQFAPAKCEIISSPVFRDSSLTIHDLPLTSTSSFVYLGMPFNIDGMDRKAHVVRCMDKALKTTQYFKSCGIGTSSYSHKTKKEVYKSFIRPQLEYCLPLLGKAEVDTLAKAQHQCCTMLLSRPTNTSQVKIQGLWELEDVPERHRQLRLGWFFLLNGIPKESRLLIQQAREIPPPKKALAKKKSVFNIDPFSLENDHLLNITNQSKASFKNYNKKVGAERWKSKNPDCTMDKQRRVIDSIICRRARWLATVWVLRSSFGKPIQCPKCKFARATFEHLKECFACDPVQMLLTNRTAAVVKMAEIEKFVMGFGYHTAIQMLYLQDELERRERAKRDALAKKEPP